MAQSTLTLLLGVGAGFYPLQSFGLSLGDLEVDSRLNEALRARIEIVGVSDDEWRQIHATVAPATYSGDGPDHPEILDVITFRPMEDTEHRRFIEVRSSEALTEPLFDLPIQVSVAALQVIRSYSVLLDPAVRSADAPMLARGEASNAAVGEATVAVTGAGGASAGSQNGAAGQNSAATAVPVTQGIPVVPSAAPVGRGAMPAAQASKKGVSARSARKHRRGTHKRSSSKRAKTQGRVAAAAKAGPTSAAAGPGAAARARTSSANAP
ncbi:MAG TPA: hypothetical protein VHB68_08510, partial [Steroidobacteraceae bacterium]|nr:hypothetical protein [Steroidobacteraceae bacterium]